MRFNLPAASVAAAVVLAGWLTPALAQQWSPVKPIRIISPFAPGGGNDALCRAVAQKLTESLKQQIIIESRPGANGIIGTELAARSAPDGYTMVMVPSGHAVNASLYKKLPFDTIKDFTMISLVGWSPLVLASHPSLPAKNVKELITFAKSRPGQLSYGSAGVGSSGHLAGAMFDTLTGTKMVHIPYKGMAMAITDIIGGQITLTFGTSASVVPHVRSGRLRALANTGGQRSPALPDLPTVAESGVPGYEASLWYGLIGPARMPADIVTRLAAEIANAVATPDVRERLASQGVDARSNTPEEFSRLLAADLKRWAVVVRQAGVTAE